MGSVRFEVLFKIIYHIFDKSLFKCGKLLRVFLWTHLRHEYTFFDSEMIIYGGKFVQA